MSRVIITVCLPAILLLVCPVASGATIEAHYEASNGTLYAVSPGPAFRAACAPIPGGYACTADGKRVVSVLDGKGCREKSGFASCLVVLPGVEYALRGTSTLECAHANYEVSDGAGGQCDGNNGEEMTCQQVNSGNYASANCETGCGPVSGSGECRVFPKDSSD